ncbi:flagellar hook protein FlgE [Kineococcus arenarius]|uniref:flagellar hook protein FlgE n=1 Tax=unclassified Kineococcus TaxID=2621656 RepID=UPI003D7EE18B
MLRSMFSGVSGLRSHQTMMDVVGNNIANVNTTAYKSSSVAFADTMSQLTQAAGAPQGGVGGTNPSQVGLGVRVNAIQQNFTQGSAQSTGKSTDLMLNGDGMFVVTRAEGTFYTRAGNFTLDQAGRLVTPDGSFVQGWRPNADGVIPTSGPTEALLVPADEVMPAVASTEFDAIGNLDKSGTPIGVAGGGYKIPDVTTSFDVFDGQGARTRVTVTFENTGTVTPAATADAAKTARSDVWNVSYSWDGGTATGGTVAFSATDGTYDPASAVTTPVVLNGVSVLPNFGAMTGLVGNGVSSVSADADGSTIGSLQSFSFGTDGTLTGTYSNGLKRDLGLVAVATFNNYEGLEKVGGSMYAVTVNSGNPNVGVAGAAGRGSLGAGQLEMSNVDLSAEFTNLILAQRGFQANSRIISASDEILQDLVNLKR